MKMVMRMQHATRQRSTPPDGALPVRARRRVLYVVCATVLAAVSATGAAVERIGRGPVLDPADYTALARAEARIAADDAEGAIADLRALLPTLSDKPYARAMTWQVLGYAAAAAGRSDEAARALAAALEAHALPPDIAHRVSYDLAHALIQSGADAAGLEVLERWLASERTPPLDARQLAVAAYTRTGQCRRALPHLEVLAREQHAAIVKWQRARLACEQKVAQDARAAVIATDLLRTAPGDRAAWDQAIAAHQQAPDGDRTVALMQLAYLRGMLDESRTLDFVRLLRARGLPYEAAQVLDAELAAGRLARNSSNLRLLGDAWAAAHERERAIEAYREVVGTVPDGNLYFAIGRLSLELQAWPDAVSALEAALRQHVLREPANTNLLLGIAALHQRDYPLAKRALDTAAKSETTRAAAAWWLRELAREGAVSTRADLADEDPATRADRKRAAAGRGVGS